MESKKPLILVSNDDGVMAKGISELVKFLRPLGEIVVMAPDSPRSGSGSALTVTHPVHYQLVKREVGLTVYKCTGTPTDCIKLALGSVLDRKPDLIVGGINHGDTSAINVHYSGTMGVVIEGCLKGIPSIGFSLCNHQPDADFEQAKGCWVNEWVTCPRLDDHNYFWLTGSFTDHELENENNDHWALENGYVAITPTTVDMTAYGFIDELNGYCQQLEF